MKRKRGSWSSEEDEESYDGSERTESDEEQPTDPGYDYRKDDSLLHTDDDEFSDLSRDPLMDRLMANTDSGVHLTAAAVYSLFTGQLLCERGYFPKVSPDEAHRITIGFDDPDYLDLRGLHLGGSKYTRIKRGPNDIIRGVQGANGCAIAKSSKALIIGIFQHPMTFSECDLVVRDAREGLINQGY